MKLILSKTEIDKLIQKKAQVAKKLANGFSRMVLKTKDKKDRAEN